MIKNKIIKLGKDTNSIEISIKNSLKAKRVSIKISSRRNIELIIPKYSSFNHAYEFLISKELWIRNKLRNIKSELSKPEKLESISILGQEYQFILDDRNIDVPIQIINNHIVISYVIPRDKINLIITSYLKKIIKKEVEDYIKIKAAELNLKYRKINIKDTVTRWGSCSSSGDISISWRLILAPRYVMEYVVIHELCHLREMNHSYKFWKLVNDAFPECDAARIWIKKYGGRLHQILKM